MKKLLLSLGFLVASLSSLMGQTKIVIKGDYNFDSLWLSIYGVPYFDDSSPNLLDVSLVEMEFTKLYIEYSKKMGKESVLDSTLQSATSFHADYLHKNYLSLQDMNLINGKINKQNPHFESNKNLHDFGNRMNNISKRYGGYYGEILCFVPVSTYKHDLYYKKTKLNEKEMAKLMFDSFLKSPNHKKIMDDKRAHFFFPSVIQEGKNFVIVVDFIGF